MGDFFVNVLSLFDGKSSGYTALELIGIAPTNYYSSEIDKHAIQVSNAIHPNQTRLGDVTKWREWDIDWASIDLILGGFPCQAWSMAGKQMGDKDERGMLFWVMLDIMKHVRSVNPKADFLIENVKMKKEFEEYITHHMTEAVGTAHKILINSALVSAQNRNRYYWTSWENEQPEDRGVSIDSILEIDFNKPNSDGWHKWWSEKSQFQLKKNYSAVLNDGSVKKSVCMTARQFSSWNGNFVYLGSGKLRNATPRECLRLQTAPEHYIDKILACGVTNTQLYKIAGNGWTDKVIAHLLAARYVKKTYTLFEIINSIKRLM